MCLNTLLPSGYKESSFSSSSLRSLSLTGQKTLCSPLNYCRPASLVGKRKLSKVKNSDATLLCDANEAYSMQGIVPSSCY